jgi:hypothetical protein
MLAKALAQLNSDAQNQQQKTNGDQQQQQQRSLVGSRIASAKSTSGLTIVDSSDEEHRTGILGRSLAAGKPGEGPPNGKTMLFSKKGSRRGASQQQQAEREQWWRKCEIFS